MNIALYFSDVPDLFHLLHMCQIDTYVLTLTLILTLIKEGRIKGGTFRKLLYVRCVTIINMPRVTYGAYTCTNKTYTNLN